MYGCQKCSAITAGLLLLAGLLFLLADIGVWSFWNLSWYTVLFIIVGITSIGMSSCKDCKISMKR